MVVPVDREARWVTLEVPEAHPAFLARPPGDMEAPVVHRPEEAVLVVPLLPHGDAVAPGACCRSYQCWALAD